ncbi:PH domain-containing protein [uncultured Microbacterium sp.]|uniref:Putative Integral membrane protein n=1 Tax=uncultured Microbacterium sp. TaxID=191216 RepID=A0A1Y5NV09_9MICO|nr:PH domain-containing protein [uncultured Microbacterium sp.]SBS70262.1 putative Integral membrane protein [uncultured Microbacterium sp.]
MPHPVRFRPRGGVILAAIAIVICAVALVSLAVTDGIEGVLQWGWPIVAFAWLAWLLYIRPSVEVTEAFVEIRNLFRTHRVPWGDVAAVESRYALTVETAGGSRIRAWAAPAPGARRALSTRREEVSRTPGDSDTRGPSDAEGTDSGDAAALVRRALEEHRRSGGVDLPGGTATTWDVVTLGVTLALLAAAGYSLVQASLHG